MDSITLIPVNWLPVPEPKNKIPLDREHVKCPPTTTIMEHRSYHSDGTETVTHDGVHDEFSRDTDTIVVYLNGKLMSRVQEAKAGDDGYIVQLVLTDSGKLIRVDDELLTDRLDGRVELFRVLDQPVPAPV
jgi:hypothetical protein